jgi:hypothetical protein
VESCFDSVVIWSLDQGPVALRTIFIKRTDFGRIESSKSKPMVSNNFYGVAEGLGVRERSKRLFLWKCQRFDNAEANGPFSVINRCRITVGRTRLGR